MCVFVCACVCVCVHVCVCVVKVECNAIWKRALTRRLNRIYHRQHAATYCNTLQHTATHYNTLQHTATRYNTLQHTTTHGKTLPGSAFDSKSQLKMPFRFLGKSPIKTGLLYKKNLTFEEPFIKHASAYYQKKKSYVLNHCHLCKSRL